MASSPQQYRQAALDCIQLADATKDSKTRVALLKLAQMWAQLADQAVKNDRVYRSVADDASLTHR